MRVIVTEFELFRSADQDISPDEMMAGMSHALTHVAEDRDGMIIIPDLPEGIRISFFDAIVVP